MNTGEPSDAGAAMGGLRAAMWVVRCLDGRTAVSPAEVGRLAAALEHRLLHPGEVVIMQGREPEGVWLIRSGTLELIAYRDRRRVTVGVLGECDIAGDDSLLLGEPASVTLRALTAAQTVFLPAAAFRVAVDTSPALARAWLAALARRQLRVQEVLAATVGGSAPGRVARLLLREACAGTVTSTQDTLASMAGLRRPTLNRVLKEFERAGLLRVGYRRIVLLSTERLRERAREARA
jgi:CRP-like cAMP-binding protein